MMQMHHQLAIDMANIAVDKGQREEVRAFARRTIDYQQKDIDELKRLQQSFKQRPPSNDTHHSMMESQSKKTMDKLRSTNGAAFDRAFIDFMIPHHEQAVDMSSPPTRFKSVEVQAFARKTIDVQRKEIQELRQLRPKG
jgi:uncharacterized protein (DUF305 family)